MKTATLAVAVLLAAGAAQAADPGIEAFNKALSDATTHMDNAATMALWEDEGVSLLPSTDPIVGKKAIAAFLDKVTQQFPGAHMTSFEMQCGGLELAGDWASEWCDEHQIVELENGKPSFDGRGRMLLVLHRGADGRWRLHREMWQPLK
ncbi:MAG: DUF4440 domain-containing protein [Burkholderiaceae bacterium]|nr:DUF4440 domain-containing protein [Burkholderiaceae bacterium]